MLCQLELASQVANYTLHVFLLSSSLGLSQASSSRQNSTFHLSIHTWKHVLPCFHAWWNIKCKYAKNQETRIVYFSISKKKSNKSYTHVLCFYLFYRTKEERGDLACCQLIIKEFFFLDHAKSLLVLVLYSRIKICVQHTGEATTCCRRQSRQIAPACTHTSTSCLMTASSSDTWVLRK